MARYINASADGHWLRVTKDEQGGVIATCPTHKTWRRYRPHETVRPCHRCVRAREHALSVAQPPTAA
jgi:hypothetical protein